MRVHTEGKNVTKKALVITFRLVTEKQSIIFVNVPFCLNCVCYSKLTIPITIIYLNKLSKTVIKTHILILLQIFQSKNYCDRIHSLPFYTKHWNTEALSQFSFFSCFNIHFLWWLSLKRVAVNTSPPVRQINKSKEVRDFFSWFFISPGLGLNSMLA